MPGHIHSRDHSPTWLAQCLLRKDGALTVVYTHAEKNEGAISPNALMSLITVHFSWRETGGKKTQSKTDVYKGKISQPAHYG